jgi:hypothetical protein
MLNQKWKKKSKRCIYSNYTPEFWCDKGHQYCKGVQCPDYDMITQTRRGRSMSEGLKQKIQEKAELAREIAIPIVETNYDAHNNPVGWDIRSCVESGEKWIKEKDILGLLDEATKQFPCLECHDWKEGKCNPYKGFVCSHQEYVEWFLSVLGVDGKEKARP